MLPSLFAPGEKAQAWSVWRAAACGAVVGALAALFKTFGPLHTVGSGAMPVWEIAAAACGFALLCAGAAVLRNVVARRLIWPDLR
jgi:4-amino-4-deoxy-L-arabinose transferase-like glycosyltransferase